MTDKNASLVLKTSDLVAGSFLAHGSANSKLSSLTWNNINLRTVLGDMYDKYNQFNLCLNTVSTAIANATIDADKENLNLYLRVSGLPFVNQTYNVKSASNGSSTVIGTFYFTENKAISQYYYSNNIATFGKSQESLSITIDYVRIKDDVIPSTVTNPYPNTIFIFDIFGIRDDDINPKNGTRL